MSGRTWVECDTAIGPIALESEGASGGFAVDELVEGPEGGLEQVLTTVLRWDPGPDGVPSCREEPAVLVPVEVRVVDVEGVPIPGVSVHAPGGSVTTGPDGRARIDVPEGVPVDATVSGEAVGFRDEAVTLRAGSPLTVSLEEVPEGRDPDEDRRTRSARRSLEVAARQLAVDEAVRRQPDLSPEEAAALDARLESLAEQATRLRALLDGPTR